jgi:hypothetical protein
MNILPMFILELICRRAYTVRLRRAFPDVSRHGPAINPFLPEPLYFGALLRGIVIGTIAYFFSFRYGDN